MGLLFLQSLVYTGPKSLKSKPGVNVGCNIVNGSIVIKTSFTHQTFIEPLLRIVQDAGNIKIPKPNYLPSRIA